MVIHYGEIIGISWFAFFVVWAVLGMVYGGQGRRRYSLAASGLRLLLLVGLLVGLRYGNLGRPLGDLTEKLAAAGAALCVLGLAFAVWARVTLGRSWGMPMTLHDNPELVTSGPYKYVRHPIYTGMSAMLLGTALVFPYGAIPCAITIGYSVFSARREERDMERRFGNTYVEYKKRSNFLVPFLF
jgi:protein-S-isoprenylcysteine O-methyltransferase Ste14